MLPAVYIARQEVARVDPILLVFPNIFQTYIQLYIKGSKLSVKIEEVQYICELMVRLFCCQIRLIEVL